MAVYWQFRQEQTAKTGISAMPRIIEPLSDTACRNHKFRAKGHKDNRLRDGGGLYLEALPTGRKVWRLEYKTAKGTKTRATLQYDYGSKNGGLADARLWRSDIKALIAKGIDPNMYARQQALQKTAEQLSTFEASVEEWLEHKRPTWSEGQHKKVKGIINRVLMPWLGKRPMRDITAREILDCLQRPEKAGKLETAHRGREYSAAIFRRAIVLGVCDTNPVDALKDALRPKNPKNFAHITDPVRIGELLRAADSYHGNFATVCLLRLAPFTFTRPSELRQSRWCDFTLDDSVFVVPEGRLGRKGKLAHVVPLSDQAVAILRELEPLTKHSEDGFVFQSPRKPKAPLSDAALNIALAKIGFKGEMTGHGFRHMASTRLHEMGWPSHVIEAQLSHKDGNAIRATYNKAEYLEDRRKLMQAWADYLDQLRLGTNKVVPIRNAQ